MLVKDEIQIFNLENLFFFNIVNKSDQLEIFDDKEMFYIIDFYNIKENMYIISSFGRIFSLYTNKQLKPDVSRGYDRVGLVNSNGKRDTFFIHRLVAMAFVPKTLDDIQYCRKYINHKDTIKRNNYYKNLEWCTSKENSIHAVDTNCYGRIKIMSYVIDTINTEEHKRKYVRGEESGTSRLTDNDVHIICKLLSVNIPYSDCCSAIGLENNINNRALIKNIKCKQTWLHISSLYDLPEHVPVTKFDFSPYVHEICKLIESGYSNTDICNTINIPVDRNRKNITVCRIRSKHIYKHISKDYNF